MLSLLHLNWPREVGEFDVPGLDLDASAFPRAPGQGEPHLWTVLLEGGFCFSAQRTLEVVGSGGRSLRSAAWKSGLSAVSAARPGQAH